MEFISNIIFAIYKKFGPFWARLHALSKQRWIRLSIQLIIIFICSIYLVMNLLTIRSLQVVININVFRIIESFISSSISIFLGAIGFYLTLHALITTINWDEAINIHLQSNLAKYIPGYAWQLIGKAYLTRKAGVSMRKIGLVMTLELALLVLAGVVISLIFLQSKLLSQLNIDIFFIKILPIIRVIAVLFYIIFHFIIIRIIDSKSINQIHSSNPFILFFASLCMLLGWFFLGFSFWLIGNGLFLIKLNQFPVFIFTLAASYLIGLAIIIVPGSIGVRESVMVWLLGPIIGPPQAVIIAALSRVIIVINELLTAYTFRSFKIRLNNPKVVDN